MFKKVIDRIKKFFSRADKLKDKLLPIAVNVVQAIKKAIESGTVEFVADIVKTLIPGTADDVVIDKAVKFAKERVPHLCIQLEILNIANSSPDVESALEALKLTYGDKWEQFTSGLAGELMEMLSDGKIDREEAKYLAKEYYDKYIKGN